MKRLVVTVLAVVVLAGCSHHPALKDAPAASTDLTGAAIVNMPDKFPNLAWKCIGVNGVYVNTRDAGVNMVVVTNDPNCKSANG